MYPNDQGFWIVKVLRESVDSEEGLRAYMNVLLRGNEAVRKYRLTKVVEHWNITPGDGHVYFARAEGFGSGPGAEGGCKTLPPAVGARRSLFTHACLQ